MTTPVYDYIPPAPPKPSGVAAVNRAIGQAIGRLLRWLAAALAWVLWSMTVALFWWLWDQAIAHSRIAVGMYGVVWTWLHVPLWLTEWAWWQNLAFVVANPLAVAAFLFWRKWPEWFPDEVDPIDDDEVLWNTVIADAHEGVR